MSPLLIGVVTVAYSIGMAVCWRGMAGHIAHQHPSRIRCKKCYRQEREPDWPFGWFVGALACPFWPLIALLTMLPVRLGAEKRAELHAREERVRAVETELGL